MPSLSTMRATDRPGTWNNAIDQKLLQVPDDPDELKKATSRFEGRLLAWDPVAQKELWSIKRPVLQNSGVLATAGGLVFQGTGTGTFEAFNATTGERVWHHATSNGMIAGPISYEQNGEQYVAIVAGYGGGFGLGEGVDKPVVRPNGRVFVFRLGGKATTPGPVEQYLSPLNPPEETFTQGQIDRGRLLFTTNCYRCHNAGAQSTGVLPDLRRSSAISDDELWKSILLEGILESSGMISFKDWLTPQEVEDIRAYIAHKADIAKQHEHN